VTGTPQGPDQRPHLTLNNTVLGTGGFASGPEDTLDYRCGYLCGLIRGDATMGVYDYSGRRRGRDVLYQFRLALADLEALRRAQAFLRDMAVEAAEFEFQAAREGYRAMRAIRTSSSGCFDRICEIIEWPAADRDGLDWQKGFLAGIFDAEGSYSGGVLRVSNMDPAIIDRTVESMTSLGFDAVIEPGTDTRVCNVRLRGGLREHLRFFHTVDPAISRKRAIEGRAIKFRTDLRVESIVPVGERELHDISTGTGDFIANGVVSHNCYARPTHEYLDLGAGTDFDTKIVYKPRAAELLRGAFDARSWKGEVVMFSGVTDCYQPFESRLGLTRACLEVCLEYRNPVGIISKSALIERDLDLIGALAREASSAVSVSLAFTSADVARAIEPWAPSPERRLATIERLARAGVPVGVMVAPIIPGLNDKEMPELLRRAAEAGATRAGWALLRLPGAVASVFEERVRAALPLAAEKILHRIRETRGGERLYDSRFHVRQRGVGGYAEFIRHLFDTTAGRLGLVSGPVEDTAADTFRRPTRRGPQLSLPILD
jgi:DNA repair photolyase